MERHFETFCGTSNTAEGPLDKHKVQEFSLVLKPCMAILTAGTMANLASRLLPLKESGRCWPDKVAEAGLTQQGGWQDP
jgi:hypothetical protein